MVDQRDERRAWRIVIVARSNGASGATIGAIVLAISIYLRDPIAAAAALGICTGAVLEITGSFQASSRSARASRTLVTSQLIGLLSALALLMRCFVAFPTDFVMAWLPASTREALLMIYPGPGEARAVLLGAARIALACCAIVAVLFEGGMAFFYSRSAETFQRLANSPRERSN